MGEFNHEMCWFCCEVVTPDNRRVIGLVDAAGLGVPEGSVVHEDCPEKKEEDASEE